MTTENNTKWRRVVCCLQRINYLMALLGAISCAVGFYLYGSHLSRIKLVVFVGWLLGSFVVFPIVDAFHNSLPNSRRYFLKLRQFNNEIVMPCFTISIFAFCSLTTWKAGDFGRQVERCIACITIADIRPSNNVKEAHLGEVFYSNTSSVISWEKIGLTAPLTKTITAKKGK